MNAAGGDLPDAGQPERHVRLAVVGRDADGAGAHAPGRHRPVHLERHHVRAARGDLDGEVHAGRGGGLAVVPAAPCAHRGRGEARAAVLRHVGAGLPDGLGVVAPGALGLAALGHVALRVLAVELAHVRAGRDVQVVDLRVGEVRDARAGVVRHHRAVGLRRAVGAEGEGLEAVSVGIRVQAAVLAAAAVVRRVAAAHVVPELVGHGLAGDAAPRHHGEAEVGRGRAAAAEVREAAGVGAVGAEEADQVGLQLVAPLVHLVPLALVHR